MKKVTLSLAVLAVCAMMCSCGPKKCKCTALGVTEEYVIDDEDKAMGIEDCDDVAKAMSLFVETTCK